VTGLVVPWSLAFPSAERILITARPGKLIAFENGAAQTIKEFTEVRSEGEEGLMGLALDPAYGQNKYLYVSLAYPRGNQKYLKVVRFRDDGARLSEEKIILDNVPTATNHAGSRIKFGPDGKLYVTTGDASQRQLAQNRNSLAGKILRLNPDGSIPEDNPFRGSPVYSLGHRNPQGIAWHPETGELYSTEHGPSLFDGPAGGDEVNRIVSGRNYGWPIVSHEKSRAGLESPLIVFTPAEAPAGAAFYSGGEIPQFRNQFFFGALRGQGLFRVKFDANDPDKVIEYEKIPEASNLGRIREVAEGPDGALYFTTSNQDGRGDPRTGDDHVYRLRRQ
jgi:glucose/arabinose dehydrogenase